MTKITYQRDPIGGGGWAFFSSPSGAEFGLTYGPTSDWPHGGGRVFFAIRPREKGGTMTPVTNPAFDYAEGWKDFQQLAERFVAETEEDE